MGNCLLWYNHKQYLQNKQEADKVLALGKERLKRHEESLKSAMDMVKSKEEDRFENRKRLTSNSITKEEAIINDVRIRKEIDLYKGFINRQSTKISNIIQSQVVLSETIENSDDLAQSQTYIKGMKRLKLASPNDVKMTENQMNTQQDTVREMYDMNTNIAEIQRENVLELSVVNPVQDFEEEALNDTMMFLHYGNEMVDVPIHEPRVKLETEEQKFTPMTHQIADQPSTKKGNHKYFNLN